MKIPQLKVGLKSLVIGESVDTLVKTTEHEVHIAVTIDIAHGNGRKHPIGVAVRVHVLEIIKVEDFLTESV